MLWDFAEAIQLPQRVAAFDGIDQGLFQSSDPLQLDGRIGLAASFSRHTKMTPNQTRSNGKIVSTDPPYYDNIGYADLSDFFYVWLRRSLRSIFPDLFATLAVPKAEELVATPYRHGSKEKAETFFLPQRHDGAMRRLAEQIAPGFPVTIYYAFKQSETKGDNRYGSAPAGRLF